MPIKKKKISELTLSDNLKGLYTIGVKLINGIQTSVKVSLEYIQTAYENAVAATDKANQAATNANNSRLQIEKNESTRQSNESARVSAESERASAETQRQTAEEERESNEVIRQQQEAEREQALKKYLPLAGGTMSGDLQFASYGNSGERGIKAVMAANDYWGITGRSTADNQGILEIYTGDDGGSTSYNEIVKFSQYSGARTTESTPVREFVVFDKSGNTSIPGTLTVGMEMYSGKHIVEATKWEALYLKNKDVDLVRTDINFGGAGFIGYDQNSGVGVIIGNGDFISGRKGCLSITSSNLRYTQNGSTYYTVYHQGNLGIATSTKSGLVKSGENIKVNSDGTMTIDNAPTTSVKDPTGEWTLRKFVDDLLNVLSGGNGNDLEAALSHLRSSFTSAQTNLAAFIEEVNTFLNDSDLSDATINRWKEIESFLAGITDTETLTGLLADTLNSAKSYTDAKKYTLPVATGSTLGGVKSGGAFISIGSDGIITVNQAKKATQDKNGADIAATYLKAAAVTDVTEYAEITI